MIMTIKRLLAAAAAFILFVGIFALPASAKITVSADTSGKITIDCGIEGMTWNLYQFSEVTDDGALKPVGIFAQYPLPEKPGVKEEIQKLAVTLENYVSVSAPAPVRSGMTGSSGKVHYANVDEGWYIAVPDKLVDGNTEYTSSPVIICVSPRELYKNYWGTDVTVQPKVDKKIKKPEKTKVIIIQYEPDKKNDTDEKEVVVIIYRDGTPYQQVILDDTNNWTVILPDIPDDDSKWVVIQKDTPDDVYPFYDRDTTVIDETPTDIITIWNKKDNIVIVPPVTSEVPQETSKPETQMSTESGSPFITEVTKDDSQNFPPVTTIASETSVSSEVTKPETTKPETNSNTPNKTTTPPKKDDSVPQTGQLWWPVPLLASAGLLLTAAGVVIRRKDQR